MIITIDGPTASGKTTAARTLAQRLGYYYLSSGLLFRGLAYVLENEFHYREENMRNPRKADIDAAVAHDRFMYRYDAIHNEQLFFDTKNITPFLRDKKITDYSSILATNNDVRQALVTLQHYLANSHDLVAEGRDTGSVVFPHAQVKFFLTASLEVRAARWQKDQEAKGKNITLDQARAAVEARDQRDCNRAIAPLCVPGGAIVIDDSLLSKEEVLALMMKAIHRLLQ